MDESKTPEYRAGTTSGSWSHVDNVVAAAKQSIDQALAESDEDRRARVKATLRLIQGGKS